MTVDKIFVLISGLLTSIFLIWFFFGKKESAVEAENEIDILVSGGYQPSKIIIPFGKKTTLNFKRIDNNSCLEEVVISEFKIKKFLPLNEKISIELTPQKKGEFDFSCGMSMYHGKLIVK